MRKPNCKCISSRKKPCECWRKYYEWRAQHREYIRLGKALFHKRRKELFDYAEEMAQKDIRNSELDFCDDYFLDVKVVVKYKASFKSGETYRGQVHITPK